MSQQSPAMQAATDRYATDHVTGQDNIKIAGLDIHNPVFLVSGVGIALFVVLTLMFSAEAEELFKDLRPWVTSHFDWVFMGASNMFLLLSVILVLSPYGSIRLGGKHTQPKYGFVSWVSMLFAAGIGIGIMFYAVLEPMNHFIALSGSAENAANFAPLG